MPELYFCNACQVSHSTEYTCSPNTFRYNPTSQWWAKADGSPAKIAEVMQEYNKHYMNTPVGGMTASVYINSGSVSAPLGSFDIIQQVTGLPTAATIPASDTPTVGESWPKDSLHDAARRVVGGMKDLAPSARRAVADAARAADAPASGRAASDGAVGRALGARLTAYGLRTGG